LLKISFNVDFRGKYNKATSYRETPADSVERLVFGRLSKMKPFSNKVPLARQAFLDFSTHVKGLYILSPEGH
jgi:hypothetical protein